MGILIQVDNGGTLTDVCAVDGERVYRAKTLTTPYDLSECFIEGLRRVSREFYGVEDLVGLLRRADVIRYSTTQGTNALVERKGGRVGLLTDARDDVSSGDPSAGELWGALVAERVATIDRDGVVAALAQQAIDGVNRLTGGGVGRIVVSSCRPDFVDVERRIGGILSKAFPPHLLGTVPVLLSHEVTDDARYARRTWSAVLNAFLHSSMEEFLYEAGRRLRETRIRAPLLIFRNDGGSARVAKTIALKTYSSGPRGGLEGARALADHYGLGEVVSIDVGGTTTDVSRIDGGVIPRRRRGFIEGVEVSLPFAEVSSFGVGGSSIVRVEKGRIVIGPESAGSTPGPAAFGRGGTLATVTDVFLLAGLFEPRTFFEGRLALDRDRAERAVSRHLAEPLGVSLDSALDAFEEAWASRIAEGVRARVPIGGDAALLAFGGAGPATAARIAEALGLSRVLIPGLAAVFSAVGIGFSDLSQEYELSLRALSPEAIEAAREDLLERAARDMFGEGVGLDECTIESALVFDDEGEERVVPLDGQGSLQAVLGDVARKVPPRLSAEAAFRLRVAKPLSRVSLGDAVTESDADAHGSESRRVRIDRDWAEVPVYRLDDQPPGATARGPAIVEEAFFTARIDAGWQFRVTPNQDLLLRKEGRRVT